MGFVAAGTDRGADGAAGAVGEGDLDRAGPELSRDERGPLARALNTLTSMPEPVAVVERGGTTAMRYPAAEALGLAALPPGLAEPRARGWATGKHC